MSVLTFRNAQVGCLTRKNYMMLFCQWCSIALPDKHLDLAFTDKSIEFVGKGCPVKS